MLLEQDFLGLILPHLKASADYQLFKAGGFMIESHSMACNRFVQLVRDFSIRTKKWEPAIRYETKFDEKHDLTLVSLRVYGRRNEFLTIMAAAGLGSFDEPLNEQILVLPTEKQLKEIKARAGYENNQEKREFYKTVI